ncbi:hypothetical protein ACFWCA_36625 [Streptomyces phaeochromogenes]|uniref:hypothetical protein n=1 Tax=Streptomyces phaeochromogenes TaxID=1923 RepID=UPI0036C1878A
MSSPPDLVDDWMIPHQDRPRPPTELIGPAATAWAGDRPQDLPPGHPLAAAGRPDGLVDPRRPATMVVAR